MCQMLCLRLGTDERPESTQFLFSELNAKTDTEQVI